MGCLAPKGKGGTDATLQIRIRSTYSITLVNVNHTDFMFCQYPLRLRTLMPNGWEYGLTNAFAPRKQAQPKQ